MKAKVGEQLKRRKGKRREKAKVKMCKKGKKGEKD